MSICFRYETTERLSIKLSIKASIKLWIKASIKLSIKASIKIIIFRFLTSCRIMSLSRRFKDRICLRLLSGWIQFSVYLCEGTIKPLGFWEYLSSGIQCCINRQCCTNVSIQRKVIIFKESTGRRRNFFGPTSPSIKTCEGWDFLGGVTEYSFGTRRCVSR